jgi:CBS domain-containing protein
MPSRHSHRAIGDVLPGARDADAVPAAPPTPTPTSVLSEVPVTTDVPDETVDFDPARRLLFGWSLRRLLDAKPPSAVVRLRRGDTIGDAMATLARHGIMSAPVVDEETSHFYGCAREEHIEVDLTAQPPKTKKTPSRRPSLPAGSARASTFSTRSWPALTRRSRARRTPRSSRAKSACESSTPSRRTSSRRRSNASRRRQTANSSAAVRDYELIDRVPYDPARASNAVS